MRITVFNGSIHGERGNTNFVCEFFASGAREAGADVETVFLAGKDIRYCAACMSCWVKTPGVCVLKDDMAELLGKFISSDVVVLATPIYVDNVTAIMKAFIDRLVPVTDPHFEKDEHGECRHRKRHERYPKFVVISTGGFPELSQFQVLSHYFQRVAGHCHSEVIGEIYRGGAILLRLGDKSPMLKPVIDAYTTLVTKAGKEIARDMRLSDELKARLDAPLIPDDVYIAENDRYWDRRLAKAQQPKD